MFFSWILLLFVGVHLYSYCKKYFETFLTYASQIILDLLQFRIQHNSLRNVPSKCVMVMSHTSIYDFVICSMIYHAYFKKRLHIYFMMKEEFGAPANDICVRFFPYTRIIPVGGEAVHSQNVVEKVVNELQDADDYVLCIAPEGTRRPVEHIRSGFYHIARGLNIPVVYCGINFASKEVTFEKGRKMGESWEVEKSWFIEKCIRYTPLYPENCYYTSNYYGETGNLYDTYPAQEEHFHFEGENHMTTSQRRNIQIEREPDDNSSYTSETPSYESRD